MIEQPPDAQSRRAGRAAIIADSALFFVNGALVASWFPRLPEIRDRLDISDSVLGAVLVGVGLGGLASSMFVGRAIDRFGSRQVSVATSVALSALIPLVGIADAALALFAALIVIGAIDGVTDVAMNAQAVTIQEATGRQIMLRFHAMWSVGTVVGGVVSSRAAAGGVSVATQLTITGAVFVIVTLVVRPFLIDDSGGAHVAADVAPSATAPPIPLGDSDRATPPSARPVLVRLFVIGIAVALAESPPNDWAALMWTDRFDFSEGHAALGYVSIVAGMVTGRFFGDGVAGRLGLDRSRRASSLLTAGGVVVGTVAPWAPLSAVGLFIAGVGVSQLFPLMVTSAAKLLAGSARGPASFSGGVRAGFLASPLLIGTLGDLTATWVAILVVSATAAIAVYLTPLHSPT